MLTFKEYIAEVFDTHYDFKKHKTGDEDYHLYSFGGDKEEGHTHVLTIQHHNKSAYADFTDRRGDSHTTGNHPKNSHKIIGTVKHIVKHHIENHPHIERIKFAGPPESGRTKLYKKLTHKHGGSSSEIEGFSKGSYNHVIPIKRKP